MDLFICAKEEHFKQYSVGDDLNIAIEICTKRDFLEEILNITLNNYQCDKSRWDLEVRRAVTPFLRAHSIDIELQERTMGFLFSIVIRVIVWIQYFSGVFGLSHDYCINILTREVFTEYGIIDEKKVSAILMNDSTLSAKQNFLLACHYCMTVKMRDLLKRLTEEDKRELYSSNINDQTHQQSMIKFWSNYLFGDIDTLRKTKSIDEFRLESAIRSGSLLAVEYCLEKITSLQGREAFVLRAAVELMKQKLTMKLVPGFDETVVCDWSPFVRYDLFAHQWVPNTFSADILYFLLKKMNKSQVAAMWGQVFRSIRPEYITDEDVRATFGFFLVWPYHYIFISLLNLSWQFMRVTIFINLLSEIFSRFELYPGHRFYCEDNYYDYRKLFTDLWNATTERLRNSLFECRTEIIQSTYHTKSLKFKMTGNDIGLILLKKLFDIQNFSYLEMNIIKLLLNNVNKNDKKILIESLRGKKLCELLLYKKRYGDFAGFASICIKDPRDIRNFRKEFTELLTKSICLKFIRDNKWKEAEHSLRWWCELSENEMNELKEAIMKSEEGKVFCLKLYEKSKQSAEYFISWGIPQDGISSYKSKLLFELEEEGFEFCEALVEDRKLPLLEKLINWCTENATEIRCIKLELAFTIGISLCRKFILDGLLFCDDDGDGYVQASRFLNWCSLSRFDEIVFKKEFLNHEEGGMYIIFDYLVIDDYENIEWLFSWVDQFEEEIKRLKKDLMCQNTTMELFSDLMGCMSHDGSYPSYKGKEESIDNFLTFFLVDLEALEMFENKYSLYVMDDLVQISLEHIHKRFSDPEVPCN